MVLGIPVAYFSTAFILLFILGFIIWMKITGKLKLNPEIIKLDEFPFNLSNVVLTKKDEYENYLKSAGFNLDSIYLVKINEYSDKYVINYLSNNREVLAVITIINSTFFITFEAKFDNNLRLVVSDFKDYSFQKDTILLQRKLFVSDLIKEHLLNSEFINSKKLKYKNINKEFRENVKNEISFAKENNLYIESADYISPKLTYIFKKFFIFIGLLKVGDDKVLKPYIDEYYKAEKSKLDMKLLLSGLNEKAEEEKVEELSDLEEKIVKDEIKPIIVKEGFGVKDNLGTLLGAGLLSFILYNTFTTFSFFEILSTKNTSTLFFILPIVIFLVFSRFLLLVLWELLRFKTTSVRHEILETLSLVFIFNRKRKFKLSDFKLVEFHKEKFREKFFNLTLEKSDYKIALISTRNAKEFLRYKEIINENYPDLYKTLKLENKNRKSNLKSIIITSLISVIFLLIIFFFNTTTIGDTKYLKGKPVETVNLKK